jgi:hypothetical protein
VLSVNTGVKYGDVDVDPRVVHFVDAEVNNVSEDAVHASRNRLREGGDRDVLLT